MVISKFRLENFRSFLSAAEVELRPLTLLYGYNNSGKTTLLRSLVLLYRSLYGEPGVPLRQDRELLRTESFATLLPRGFEQAKGVVRFGLTLKAKDRECPLEWELRPMGASDLPVISEFRFELANGRQVILKINPDKLPNSVGVAEYSATDESWHGDIAFAGLLPFGILGDSGGPWGGEFLDRIGKIVPRGAASNVQWLWPTRDAAAGEVAPAGISTRPFGPNGEGLLDLLAQERVNSLQSGPVGEGISKWLQKYARRTVVLRAVGERFCLNSQVVSEAGSPMTTETVSLAAAGEGIVQVIPVLAAIERYRATPETAPALICVEEPESHLHPRLQAGLGEYFCQVAADKNPPTMLMETHSEVLMLAVQLAVARRQISPDAVVVYWVRQTEDGQSWVEKVTFDENGQPGRNWPPLVFGEDLRLSRDLIQARRHAAETKTE